ncbi:MAG: putative lipid II flippase FtsW [Patescibacteria group bacterium]|jgi:cell division protein FtsW|nr:putative lipid II flippase FtsW [Patescibacteria group bacterium]
MRPERYSTTHPVGNPSRKHRPDYGLFVIASMLLAIGLIVMYAISPALAAQGGDVSDNYFVIRQSIAIIIGFVAFYVFSKIPIEIWSKWYKILIISAIILSLGTIITGGLANRWIQLGAFSFQTVEYVKLVTVLVFSGYIAEVADRGMLASKKNWQVLAIIALSIGLIVVLIQRDLGSAAVLFAMLLAMLFLAGFPLKYFILIVASLAMFGLVATSYTEYRRDRVFTFLNPMQDCTNEGYHACQALIAVGSGGLLGVGLGKSVQAYGYLPEAENDSIFAIYAEKFGFIGSLVLIGLFGSLLMRIFNIMQRAPNRTMQLITAGVFTWFLAQGAINIAAMLGLIPLKGITLPFISYGGTSLIFSMAALGLVFQVSKYTSMRRTTYEYKPAERGDGEDTNHWRRNGRPHYTVTRRSV